MENDSNTWTLFCQKHTSFLLENQKNLLGKSGIWNKDCTKKVSVFSWIVLFRNLNTYNVLQKNLPFLALHPSICVLCMAQEDTQNHALFWCPFAASCWKLLLASFNLQWVFSDSARGNLNQLLNGPNVKPLARLLW